MARIDWTRIFVAAPGLRPTASAALKPMPPILTATATAVSATLRFPVISASKSIANISLFLSLVSRRLPRLDTVKPPRDITHSSGRGRFFLLWTRQQHEHRGQQHEDHGLDEAHQQFHEVERNRKQPAQARNQLGHGVQHVLPGKHIAVETKTQG